MELLADSSFWKPEESNELYRLNLRDLIAGQPPNAGDDLLLDPSIHPLAKIAYVTGDLEVWHGDLGLRGAALEARLERLGRLWSSLTESYERQAILKDLQDTLPAYRDVEWWSMGQATLAEFVQQGDEPKKLVRAREIAQKGYEAYPKSIGGARCLHIVKSIEAPDFSLSAMSSDGLGKRSILVEHKNIDALYFRAYSYNVEQRLQTARDYNLLPNQNEQKMFIAGAKPAFEWVAPLPSTPDFESHKTFVTPPLTEPGFYILVASAKKDFSETVGNRVLSVNFLASGLVLLNVRPSEEAFEVRVVSGETGQPVQGADVGLYQFDWQKGHHQVGSCESDELGFVRFKDTAQYQGGNYFLFCKKGKDLALDSNYLYFYRAGQPQETTATLFYTDRSIYRPGQKLFWKVLAYKGRQDLARFSPAASSPVTVSLVDPNGEKVDSATVTSNSFGTAAGEFTVPAGHLLGVWRLQSSLNGGATVRVEEYKRPTFEVTFKDPTDPLRLNKSASLTGEVKYYFGLPVVNGSAKWRATRQPLYPWWWDWFCWWRPRPSAVQTVATGTAQLKEDGTFTVAFTPQADEQLSGSSKDVTYRYSVTADVTDEGGETRSASKAFRLGFVSVEARLDTDYNYFTEGSAGSFDVVRTDLNGTPRPGKGAWRLNELVQPEKAVPPADLPMPKPESSKEEVYTTPGDALRPRWDSSYSYLAILHSWKDGAEKARGRLVHGEKGEAELKLPALPAGAYRVTYDTVDDFGTPYTTSKEFIVAGPKANLTLPCLLLAEKNSGLVGGKARFLAISGLPDQPLNFEVWRGGSRSEQQLLSSGKGSDIVEIPLTEQERGGFSVRLSAVRDFQFMEFQDSFYVPWDSKELKVQFTTFRDKIRPGGKETWRVTVNSPQGKNVEAGAAELLAYMYDRSLDIFAPHTPPSVTSIYPGRMGLSRLATSLGEAYGQWVYNELVSLPSYPSLDGDRLKFYDSYGLGGPGRRYGRAPGSRMTGAAPHAAAMAPMAMPAAPPMPKTAGQATDNLVAEKKAGGKGKEEGRTEATTSEPAPASEAPVEIRSNFAETAFWKPQLLTDKDGSAVIEFTVPDSVTGWNVWVHAVTRDMTGGSLKKETKSVKELMVRPYVPRFLREGDKADLKVVVNNASDKELKGQVTFEILDPDSNQSLLDGFGLKPSDAVRPFTVKAGGGANLTFPITAPVKVGSVAFKVVATSGEFSDGELRPLPILPGRMHLMQSRFVTLKNKDRREMTFADMKAAGDPTLVNEQLVVTLDAQLFYSVLSALPYLVNYPYECTEQTLNRFVSTGILSSLYKDYPAVSKMAEDFSKRETPIETWDQADPNRKMALEETPWLAEARGQQGDELGSINVLDPRIAKANRDEALAKLQKTQTANGAFPWFPGGPPSPYMTLYILYGFSKALEFQVDVPKDVVQKAWGYMHEHYVDEMVRTCMAHDSCWEMITFLNYALSNYPDSSWTGGVFTDEERTRMLNFSFKHWKEHSPLLKCELALTLKRMGRPKDAALVFESVMDSAKSTQDEGTFWAAEDRSWLWYNDTIETHAFALRTLMEITPADGKKDGLVQWIFLNKKLNHWKSTRATAEVIYALVHYLQKEGALGTREDATVHVCNQTVQYVFEPDKYTGKKNQTVIPGEKMDPATCSTVVVEKESKGIVFASATWSFSTEKLPEEDRGDFLSVTRSYFKRENTGTEFVLRPLAEGAALAPGDEVEIHLSIRCKHPCEYVHLRDPRAAGLEPENPVSRFKWDLGIGWYEEVRDSGTNFFFEWLPQGEYTFKYRLRANMAGAFKVSPATLQSMYAPEFNAYSAGALITIKGEK